MSEERTYPREWFCDVKWRPDVEAQLFVRETASSLFDDRGGKYAKVTKWRTYYPTREEAQAAVDARLKREAENDAADGIRDAAPKLLAACERLVTHFVIVHKNAIGPGGRFCSWCGRNSETDTHDSGCVVKKAEDAIAEAKGNA